MTHADQLNVAKRTVQVVPAQALDYWGEAEPGALSFDEHARARAEAQQTRQCVRVGARDLSELGAAHRPALEVIHDAEPRDRGHDLRDLVTLDHVQEPSGGSATFPAAEAGPGAETDIR